VELSSRSRFRSSYQYLIGQMILIYLEENISPVILFMNEALGVIAKLEEWISISFYSFSCGRRQGVESSLVPHRDRRMMALVYQAHFDPTSLR
jgi:hypothetical protein